MNVSNANVIKNAKVKLKRIEAQMNDDHLQLAENEPERKEKVILYQFQNDKSRQHKLMQLDLLFLEK